MIDMTTRRFSTHSSQPDNVSVLHDGVPEWMVSSIDLWLKMVLTYKPAGRQRREVEEGLIRKIERKLRKNITNGATGSQMLEVIFNYMNADPELKLDVAEAILELKDGVEYEAVMLDEILKESGSRWRIKLERRGHTPSFEERIDETAAAAFSDATKSEDNTSNYLKLAWSCAFGRSPDPSQSYGNSIKAIEAATWSLVMPGNPKATLGDIIRQLETNGNQWQASITEKVAGLGIEATVKQMKLIWQGQTDRHATATPVTPSQEAAEQSVINAVAVCQQFKRGLIKRV